MVNVQTFFFWIPASLRSFVPRIGRTENPALYDAIDTGNLTWPSAYDLIMNRFPASHFEL
jgi:hypothetical protein